MKFIETLQKHLYENKIICKLINTMNDEVVKSFSVHLKILSQRSSIFQTKVTLFTKPDGNENKSFAIHVLYDMVQDTQKYTHEYRRNLCGCKICLSLITEPILDHFPPKLLTADLLITAF